MSVLSAEERAKRRRLEGGMLTVVALAATVSAITFCVYRIALALVATETLLKTYG